MSLWCQRKTHQLLLWLVLHFRSNLFIWIWDWHKFPLGSCKPLSVLGSSLRNKRSQKVWSDINWDIPWCSHKSWQTYTTHCTHFHPQSYSQIKIYLGHDSHRVHFHLIRRLIQLLTLTNFNDCSVGQFDLTFGTPGTVAGEPLNSIVSYGHCQELIWAIYNVLWSIEGTQPSRKSKSTILKVKRSLGGFPEACTIRKWQSLFLIFCHCQTSLLHISDKISPG